MGNHTVEKLIRSFISVDAKVRAAIWVFLQYGLAQLIRLATNLVLARLVAPDVFGVMALAFTFIAALMMVSDVGIYGIVVKTSRGHDPRFLHTAWTLQGLRGVVLYGFCLLLSFALARLQTENAYGFVSAIEDPRLPFVFATVSLIMVFEGFRSIGMILAFRNFAAGRVVRLELFCQLISSFAILLLAFLGFDIWAVVIGVLVGSLMLMVGSHMVLYAPRAAFCLEKAAVREVFDFGKWIFAASILTFIVSQADKIVFGLLLSPNDFGIYAVATAWIVTVTVLLQSLMRKVFQPAFAQKLNEGNVAALLYYKQIRQVLEPVCLGLVIFFYFTGELVFGVLYDERYTNVGFLISFLCVRILAEPFYMLNTFLLAAGRARQQLQAVAGQLVFILLFLPLALLNNELELAMIVFALSILGGAAIAWHGVRQVIPLPAWPEIRFFLYTVVLAGMIMFERFGFGMSE